MHLVVAACALLALATADKYSTYYDNMDVDAIIKNDRLIEFYFKCFMDKGKCTPVGEMVKKNIPDALKTGCADCSEKQKEVTKKLFKYAFENKKDLYLELEAKYDPDGIYRKKYRKQAEEDGIKI